MGMSFVDSNGTITDSVSSDNGYAGVDFRSACKFLLTNCTADNNGASGLNAHSGSVIDLNSTINARNNASSGIVAAFSSGYVFSPMYPVTGTFTGNGKHGIRLGVRSYTFHWTSSPPTLDLSGNSLGTVLYTSESGALTH